MDAKEQNCTLVWLHSDQGTAGLAAPPGQSRLQNKLVGRMHVRVHTRHGANRAGQEEKQKRPN